MAAAVSPFATPPGPIANDPDRRRGALTHIVHASTYPVFPREHGGAIRAHALADALAVDGFRSTIVSLTHDPSQVGTHQLADNLVEMVIQIPPAIEAVEAKLRLLAGPAAITDICAGLCWTGIPAFVDTLSEQLADANAALAVQTYLGPALDALAPHLPLFLDAHNDEFALKSDLLGSTPGGRWLVERVRDLESLTCDKSRMVVAATKGDLSALDRRYMVAAISDVVPNGVDTSTIPFVTGGDRIERRHALCMLLDLPVDKAIAMFVGSAHGPNLDAAVRLIDVARTRPAITFVLVGDHTRMLRRRVPDNIRPLGKIPEDELDLLLAGADIALNPMESGSGSNLKLLSYLAAGLRIVATPTGARGIDADAAGIVVCDAAHFAEGIDEALVIPADTRAQRGRRYVEETASWSAIGSRFRNMVRLAVGR